MKKTLAAYWVALSVLALLWAGCDQCPAEEKKTYEYNFFEPTTDFVPYAVGDSFRMYDSLGGVRIFAVFSSDIVPKEEQCECCPLVRRDELAVSVMEGPWANQLAFYLLQDGNDGDETDKYLSIKVGSSIFYLRFDSSGAAQSEGGTSLTTHNSFPVGSHTYLNVYELHNGTTDSTQANAVWYSTQGGLLRYQLVNGEVWSLP